MEQLLVSKRQLVHEQVLRNNTGLRGESVRKILILHEDTRNFYIGDTCLRMDELRICRLFFQNASIDINFSAHPRIEHYKCLLSNNPHIDKVLNQEWHTLDIGSYDVIICITYNEEKLLHLLDEKFGDQILEKQWPVKVFSITEFLLDPIENGKVIFPLCQPLFEYSANHTSPRPTMLYISQEEKEWGNQWLREHGLEEGERLFIILDSTARRNKLLRMDVYSELVDTLLNMPDAKVLIFDEKNIGKENFYKELLGEKALKKIIFSKRLTLRQDLCLMSSDYTDLILGPCTGLLHCASGIYNNFVDNGMATDQVPLMITYTGKYMNEKETAQWWWKSSPLINCLVLRRNASIGKEAVLLSDLSDEEKMDASRLLFCEEYEADMILTLINRKLKKRTITGEPVSL